MASRRPASGPPRVPNYLKNYAAENRENLTGAEARLWERLPDLGARIWRQHAVRLPGRDCIVDFFFPDHALVVEVDGPYHKDQRDEDRERDQALGDLGLRVLRFNNWQVFNKLGWVLGKIRDEL